MTVDFNIYHVRGVTEALIGSNEGDTIVGGVAAQYHSKTQILPMTRTRFVAGDVLRVNAVVWVGAGTAKALYYDPSGHITETDNAGGPWSSQLKVNIPFEVQP